MRHKYQVVTFLAVALSLVLVLPAINVFDSISHREQQKHTLMQAALHTMTEERLFSTDGVQGMARYQAWQQLGRSLDEGQVVAGRDGYLFLGNDFNSVVDKSTGRFPVSTETVERWASGLADLKHWYESQQIPFAIAVAPNKHTVYPEKLPSHHSRAGKTVTDLLLDAAASHGTPIYDMRAPLLMAKRDLPLYYRTDTHWNRRAAGLAYQGFLTFSGEQTGFALTPASIDLVPGVTGAGDLTRLLKVERFLPAGLEDDPRYQHGPHQACVGELDLANGRVGPCELSDRPVAQLTEAGQYVKSDHALNTQRVLWLGDSFTNAQTELVARTFSTVWFVHWVYVQPEALARFVRAVKPDLVLYQVIERDLLHDKLIEPLPDS
ncbi:MAG: hypothetical protein AB8C46_01595 [Burkholderiaceae bacterium]